MTAIICEYCAREMNYENSDQHCLGVRSPNGWCSPKAVNAQVAGGDFTVLLDKITWSVHFKKDGSTPGATLEYVKHVGLPAMITVRVDVREFTTIEEWETFKLGVDTLWKKLVERFPDALAKTERSR